MKQADLARITGIRPTTISELYNEVAERVSFDHLDKICEALNCTLNELLEYIPNQHRRTGKDLILEEHGNRKKNNHANLGKKKKRLRGLKRTA